MASVLVVEDDQFVRSALIRHLTDAAHTVRSVGTALEALREVAHFAFDVVILDLGLPDLDGSEALKMLRGITDVPVIIATARDDETEIVRLLNAGADDYLTKPFSNAELVARVEALLRRVQPAAWSESLYDDGVLHVDPATRTVLAEGRKVNLTVTEFRLLNTLVRNAGRVLSQAQLLSLVWDDPSGIAPERVKFAVLRLRRKLGWLDPASAPVESVRGIGYRYRPPDGT
jgi:DNA-binding response OmpR family regulator